MSSGHEKFDVLLKKFVWVNDLVYCDAEQTVETTRKLGTRLNEHRESVQACDLKSVVSEHAKDAGVRFSEGLVNFRARRQIWKSTPVE